MNLREIKGNRPVTYSLMADLLDKVGVQIESVAVSALENECFYATIEARNGENAIAVDARPSDAIALALHTRSPILVAEAVMDAAGEEIPEDMEVPERGQGLDEVLKAGRPSVSREEQEAWQSKSPEQRREENRKKLFAYLTGASSPEPRCSDLAGIDRVVVTAVLRAGSDQEEEASEPEEAFTRAAWNSCTVWAKRAKRRSASCGPGLASG